MARMKKNKTLTIALDIIMVCLIGICAISGYKLYDLMKNYKADQNVYTEVRAKAGDRFDIDWDAMWEINPDIVAWLYLEDSKIDYPVVQGKDNDEYLHKLVDGTPGFAGTLFADGYAAAPFRQFSTIIYGHHMKDVSMFNNLKKFKSKDYVKKHHRFELITPEGKFHLEVCAFLNQPATSPLYQSNVGEGQAQSYLDMITKNAEYMTSVEVGPNDRIVLMSTCAYEYDDARYVVVGKMVPWEE